MKKLKACRITNRVAEMISATPTKIRLRWDTMGSDVGNSYLGFRVPWPRGNKPSYERLAGTNWWKTELGQLCLGLNLQNFCEARDRSEVAKMLLMRTKMLVDRKLKEKSVTVIMTRADRKEFRDWLLESGKLPPLIPFHVYVEGWKKPFRGSAFGHCLLTEEQIAALDILA